MSSFKKSTADLAMEKLQRLRLSEEIYPPTNNSERSMTDIMGDILQGVDPAKALYSPPSNYPSTSATRLYSESLDGSTPDTRGKIRLLRLDAPAHHSGSPVFTLSTESISSSLEYDTLSYTWGKGQRSEEVMIDGNKFRITQTLKDILQYVASSMQYRPIWIDQISINQDDTKEKSYQVSLMAQIYRQSENTLIWLGQEENRIAFKTLRQLSPICTRIMQAHHTTFLDLRDSELATKDPEDYQRRVHLILQDYKKALKSIAISDDSYLGPWIDLLSRNWWSRAWIRQELIIATKPIFISSNDVLDWDDFAPAMRFNMMKADFENGIGGFIREGDLITRFLSTAREHAMPMMLFREDFEKKTGGLDFRSVVQALNLFTHAACGDPRDRIYSIMGLTSRVPDCLQVDYSLSKRDVFINATKAIIEDSWHTREPLKILTYVQRPQINMTLPSWAPDFERKFTRSIAEAIGNERYAADYGINPAAVGFGVDHFFVDSDLLKLMGVSFDTISILGLSFEETCAQSSGEDSWVSVQDWLDLCMAIFNPLLNEYDEDSSQLPGTASSSKTAVPGMSPYGPIDEDDDQYLIPMIKTILMDQTAQPINISTIPDLFGIKDDPNWVLGRTRNIDIHMFMAWLGTAEVPEGYPTLPDWSAEKCLVQFTWPLLEHAKKVAWGKRPMRSTKGYYGLVPSGACDGDELVVIYGCPIPLVVRKWGDKYRLIGGSYTHGAMYGEMVDGRPIPPQMFTFA